VTGAGRLSDEQDLEAAGGPAASIELRRARLALSGGRWHDYEALVRALIPLVPPGRAARAAEVTRAGQARRRARARGEPFAVARPRARPVDPDRLREFGARVIIAKMLRDAGFEVAPAPGSGGLRKRIRM